MPGSQTTPGRTGTRVGAPAHVAFRYLKSVGTRDVHFAARWLAYALPCRRFADTLTGADARLGADVDRYSFIAADLHRLLLAGLPAHSKWKPPLIVEDEVLIAWDLELMLAQQGWRVLGPAMTVHEALLLLQSQTPDVAVLDVNLGGEMVTPVAEKLQILDVPFVLASAYGQLEALGPVLAGVPNVGKPVIEGRLLAALAEIVQP